MYILYFFNSNLIEGFGQTLDCSQCEMKPYSGDCQVVYDIKVNDYGDYTNIGNIDVSLIDTGYVFCPWEPNCTGDAYLANITKQDGNKEINNIICCSNSDFYDNTTNYNSLSYASSVNEKCEQINIDVSLAANNDPNFNIDTLPEDFYKLRSVCNKQDFSGMLFKKNSMDTKNILLDPNLLPDEILNYLSILNTKIGLSSKSRYNTITNDLLSMSRKNNIKVTNLNQLTQEEKTKKFEYQKKIVSEYLVSDISHETFNYIPYKSDSTTQILNPNTNTSYLLVENEFLDCFGSKQNYSAKRFSEVDKKDLSDNAGQYFDISDDKITTMQDSTQRLYPNQQDLEMELKRLEQIQPGGTAPTSVINQYLTAINGFYEKQMSNMMGPKTHAVNQQLVFDNNTLDTKESTFFVYETDPNNEYKCRPSITGEKKFNYCGPPAFSKVPKF